jgi:hypothetical protein
MAALHSPAHTSHSRWNKNKTLCNTMCESAMVDSLALFFLILCEQMAASMDNGTGSAPPPSLVRGNATLLVDLMSSAHLLIVSMTQHGGSRVDDTAALIATIKEAIATIKEPQCVP